MSGRPRYRAWRFLHPDADAAKSEPPGLRINARGGIAMVEEQDSVRQAIFLLLSTVPGERVMRPDYGCNLHRLVFAPNNNTTAGLAMLFVRRALERWEPRVEIMRLDATRSLEEPNRLDLLLEYRVRASQHVELLNYSVSLMGEKI